MKKTKKVVQKKGLNKSIKQQSRKTTINKANIKNYTYQPHKPYNRENNLYLDKKNKNINRQNYNRNNYYSNSYGKNKYTNSRYESINSSYDRRGINRREIPQRDMSRRNVDRRSRYKKKVKNRNINIISKIFTSIIFLLILGYLGVSIIKSMNKSPIYYETIEYGTIDNIDSIKGVIIRDETVYKATKNGDLIINKNGNDKVKKGEIIATVKDQAAVRDDEQDIKKLDEKILQLQEERDELSIFYEDTKKIDLQIQKTLDSSIKDLSTYDISKIYELRDNLNKKITIRNQMLLSENSETVQDLASQKLIKEEKVSQNVENLYAQQSGIVSYYTDGFEETFTFENKDKLTKEQIIMKVEDGQDYKVNIVQGEPVFKIVKDNNFYIASYIKNEKISSWKEKETRNIYINDTGNKKTLEVIIDKIEPGEKESYVLMKTNKNMIDFIDKRNITFEINKQQEGFKIKLQAVSEEELLKIPSSYVVEDNVIKKNKDKEEITVPITISEKEADGSYVYVNIIPNILDVGDFILEPNTKKEIQLNEIFVKKGIYIVNSGIYTFKSINTEGSVEDEEFIIIEPTKNTSIQLYDRYAPDLSVVKGEETKNE